ncbi:putative maltose permease [Leptodontidium sp. 2 PMI_412]|nr:putative maltose permease [Leptodontidium sp. 2 PMI_412]
MADLRSTEHAEHKLAAPAPSLAPDTIGIDDDLLLRMAENVPDLADLIEGAQRASNVEHQLTSWEAFKLYYKAVAFSTVLSLAIIMEGYDTALLGSFFGYPTFRERFGVPLADGSYQITSKWQSGLQNGAQIGQILGLMVTGVIADRIGYKKTILGALVLMICFIFILFFAQNIGMLFAGEVLCGLPWGAFQTLTTTYAAEVSPTVLRPYLTTFVNLCWVTGQFIAIGVLRGLLGRTDEWSWRIPFAIQWVWPIPIIIGVIFAPESPWWLVRNGQLDEARRSLSRLTSKTHHEYNIDDNIAFMVVTNEQEKLASEGVSYWDCFKGIDRRRTEVTCCVWMIQVGSGIWFGSNVVYFMEQAGFPPTRAFDFGLGMNGVGWVGTVCSWFVMQHVGRRTLYSWGLAVMLAILLIVGFLGIPSAGNVGIGYTSGALLMIFVFTYDITVGPVCYCLISELPSTRLRIKTAVLARNCYNIVAIAANFLNPPILNPTAWNLRGKGGFIWSVFCGISLIWTIFRLPEPRGRTPAELDVLFEQRIPARKFAKTKADPFRSTNLGVVGENMQEGKQ